MAISGPQRRGLRRFVLAPLSDQLEPGLLEAFDSADGGEGDASAKAEVGENHKAGKDSSPLGAGQVLDCHVYTPIKI